MIKCTLYCVPKMRVLVKNQYLIGIYPSINIVVKRFGEKLHLINTFLLLWNMNYQTL